MQSTDQIRVFVPKKERMLREIQKKQQQEDPDTIMQEEPIKKQYKPTRERSRDQQQLKKIKKQYLNTEKKPKSNHLLQLLKYRKTLNFEWDNKDDTSEGSNIYHFKHKQKNKDCIGEMDHWSKKTSQKMTDRDWRIYRQDNNIIVKGGRAPNPVRQWYQMLLPKKLLHSISMAGYHTPKPIQSQAIPIGLQKKDLIAIAPTGEGKTAAFLIPMINYILSLPPMTFENARFGPYALILAPSRQLAQQIFAEFQLLTQGIDLKGLCLVGGHMIDQQGLYLSQSIQLVVGTPGRIRQTLEKKYLSLQQCSWIIMDEADKMIQNQMEKDVRQILEYVGSYMKSQNQQIAKEQSKLDYKPGKAYRITHMFSATMAPQIQQMAKMYLRSFCYISIGEPGLGKQEIQYRVEIIQQSQKKFRLEKILKGTNPPIIIFTNQRQSCDILARSLQKRGWKVISYHGGKSQQNRQNAIAQFKQGIYDILIATDLGGRGLHVEGVTMVINFDGPKNIIDFIHRCGRTGRVGKKGIAHTFLTAADQHIYFDVRQFLIKTQQKIPQQLQNNPISKIKPGSFKPNVPRKKQIIYM